MAEFGKYNLNPLVDKYEKMLRSGEVYFFDIEDFEIISDYYISHGDDVMAIDVLSMAISQHSDSADLLVRRAQLYIDVLKMEKAKRDLNNALELDPEHADGLIVLAEWHSKRGQHNKAIQNLRLAAEILGSYEEINLLLAQEYLEMANYRKAAEYFKAVLLEDYDDGSALFSLSFCYDMLGETHELINFLKQYINDNPYSEIAWHQLGLLYQKNRQYDLAIEAYDYACLVDEYFSAAYYEKARTYEEMGDFEKAIATYEEIMEIEDSNTYAYLRIGLAYREMGDDTKAMRFLQRSLLDDPESEDVLINIISIYESNAEWLEAVHYAKQLIKVSEAEGVRLYIGYIFKQAGLLEEACQIFEEMIHLPEAPLETFFVYSDILTEQLEHDRALKVMLLGHKQFPDNHELPLRLGSAFYHLEEMDLSVKFFNKAHELNPEDTLVFFESFPSRFILIRDELNF